MTEKYVPAKLRREVGERASYCCEYCRCQENFSPQTLSIEHIIPRNRGGQTIAENLAYACQGCNSHKSTKTTAPDEFTNKMVPLFNPRQQQWSEHFTWNEDYSEIVGLTPIGRATLIALHLNRHSLINLRRALYLTGKHPPLEEHE
jgi:hypothetical protein